ncbi:MAG: serine/threonine protein kinase [Polyangiales bacterium]
MNFHMTETSKGNVEDPLIGTLLAERYRITRLAGEGGMGRVYLGLHEGIGRRVAIKVLLREMTDHPGLVERFEQEARAATACGSEHIIDVFDMGRLDDDTPYMVMEFLEGEDLGQLLDREGAQTTGRVARIMQQACDGLEVAHTAGIVHRDLKPENIYLLQRKKKADFVKILDFGISKITEHAAGFNKHLTQTGVTVGTPLYMSPEQAQGLKTMDHRTDIYSLGVILYEALTGDPPFDADSFALLMVKIVTGDTPDVRIRRPDVPEGLAHIISKCLNKSPDLRFHTAEELGHALAEYATLDEVPQLLEARGESMTIRPGHSDTRSDGGPITGAALPRSESATAVSRPTPLLRGPSAAVPADTRRQRSVDTQDVALPTHGPNKLVWAGIALALVGAITITAAIAVMDKGEEIVPDPVVVSAPLETTEVDMQPTSMSGAAVMEAEDNVRLRIVVAPAEASIFIDDVEYPSPLDARLARTQAPSRIRIELSGYESVNEVILLDQDREILRVLERASRSPRMTAVMESTMVVPMGTGAMESEMTVSSEMNTTMMDGFREDF